MMKKGVARRLLDTMPVRAKKKASHAKKNPVKKKASPARKAVKAKAAGDVLDLGVFSPESIFRERRWLCLACTLDVFTRHLGVAAAKAWTEVKQHQPGVDELASRAPERPYFEAADDHTACPYCGAAAKWQAPLDIARIEGGKATDAARRALVKRLPGGGQFHVVEEKATRRDALYDWLAKTEATLDLHSPGWLLEAARHWLGRRLPKEDWAAIFARVRIVRRSRRLEDGYEVDEERLFLAAHLFDEILLVQYLLSRSHMGGGLTFEGRFTLRDLYFRLRGGGYLRTMGVTADNADDALENLMELLGGEERIKFHYIVDRRAFLDRVAELRSARIPRPRIVSGYSGG
jgi:hypothetical protein